MSEPVTLRHPVIAGLVLAAASGLVGWGAGVAAQQARSEVVEEQMQQRISILERRVDLQGQALHRIEVELGGELRAVREIVTAMRDEVRRAIK